MRNSYATWTLAVLTVLLLAAMVRMLRNVISIDESIKGTSAPPSLTSTLLSSVRDLRDW